MGYTHVPLKLLFGNKFYADFYYAQTRLFPIKYPSNFEIAFDQLLALFRLLYAFSIQNPVHKSRRPARSRKLLLPAIQTGDVSHFRLDSS